MQYTADSIEVLTGLQAIRKRPGMYIGPIDSDGFHNLIAGAMNEVAALHAAGNAHTLRVEVDGLVARVQDDGPGLPLEAIGDGRPAMRRWFEQLFGCGHGAKEPPLAPSSGFHLAAVNALSRRLSVVNHREGRAHRIVYSRGEVIEPLEPGPTCERTGLTLEFEADPDIFPNVVPRLWRIRHRAQSLAYLQPALQVTVNGERLSGGTGLATLCESLAEGAPLLAPILRARGVRGDAVVDAAIGWQASGTPMIRQFCGLTPDPSEGSPGLHAALEAFHSVYRKGLLAVVRTNRRHDIDDAIADIVGEALAIHRASWPDLGPAV